MKTDSENAAARFDADERLEVRDVRALAERLQALLDLPQTDIEINLSRVETADTAGIQLLAACVREAQKRGKVIHFEEPGTSFLDVLQLLGMTAEISLTRPHP